MHAIPTLYDGVQYRSRLEAKWAAFFKFIHWPVEYEPFDLDGYIPDFIAKFPKAPLLIEVKPAITLDELYPHFDKIDASGWKGESIVVGASLFRGWSGGYSQVGVIRDDLGATSEAMLFRCIKCKAVSVCSESMSWQCRVNGCYDGDGHLGEFPEAESMFRHAGNVTQWKGAACSH